MQKKHVKLTLLIYEYLIDWKETLAIFASNVFFSITFPPAKWENL